MDHPREAEACYPIGHSQKPFRWVVAATGLVRIAALMVILLAFLGPLAARADAQCTGYCEQYLSIPGCGCDQSCRDFQDCCSDFLTACPLCGDGRWQPEFGEECDASAPWPPGQIDNPCCDSECRIRSGSCESSSCSSGTCAASGSCVPQTYPTDVPDCSARAASCVVDDYPAGTDCSSPGHPATCDGAGSCVGTGPTATPAPTPTPGDCDDDGVTDDVDGCPADPTKTSPGSCGCGHPEGSCPGLCTRNVCNGYLSSGPNTCFAEQGHLSATCRAVEGCYCDAACIGDCCPEFDYASACGAACGDGVCTAGEDSNSCPTDCASCLPNPTGTATPAPTGTPTPPSVTPTATATPGVSCPTTAASCVGGFAMAKLLVKEKTAGKEQIQAKFAKGPAIAQAALGNPLGAGGTAYGLCIYGAAGTLVEQLVVDRAGVLCGAKPCWKSVGSAPPDHKGFAYTDGSQSAAGVKAISMKSGAAGKSMLLLKASNNASKGLTAMPTGITAALAGTTTATIQLRTSAGICFSATLVDVKTSDSNVFQAGN